MTKLSSQITAAQVSLSNLPERTVWVDNTVLDILAANSLGDMSGVAAAQKPTTVNYATGQVTKDSNGKYYFQFNVELNFGGGSSTTKRFWFKGISRDDVSIFYNVSASQINPGTTVTTFAGVENANDRVIVEMASSTNNDRITASGKVELVGKPDWFDEYREAGFSVAAQIESATANSPGLIPSYEVYDFDMDNHFNANTEMRIVKIGKLVTLSNIDIGGDLGHVSSATPETSGGLIPDRFRPAKGMSIAFGDETTNFIAHMEVKVNGSIQFHYMDMTGSNISRSSTGANPTISYVVA